MRKGLSCIGLWLCLLLIIGCSNSDSQPENVEVYLEANTDRVLLKEEGGYSLHKYCFQYEVDDTS